MENKILYVVATPIGNLSDITLRAIETLKSVDLILCEDTRVSHKLLEHFGIEKKTLSLHQHTEEEKIRDILGQYNSYAYVTDAGTPGISDPGNKLVQIADSLLFQIVPIPGASSVTAALSVSGFPTDKFIFLGFLPKKGKNKTYKIIKDSEFTCGFFESPHRIVKTLTELKEVLEPERQLIVCRELTKKFETIYRGNVEKVLKEIELHQKGEFVVFISR